MVSRKISLFGKMQRGRSPSFKLKHVWNCYLHHRNLCDFRIEKSTDIRWRVACRLPWDLCNLPCDFRIEKSTDIRWRVACRLPCDLCNLPCDFRIEKSTDIRWRVACRLPWDLCNLPCDFRNERNTDIRWRVACRLPWDLCNLPCDFRIEKSTDIRWRVACRLPWDLCNLPCDFRIEKSTDIRWRVACWLPWDLCNLPCDFRIEKSTDIRWCVACRLPWDLCNLPRRFRCYSATSHHSVQSPAGVVWNITHLVARFCISMERQLWTLLGLASILPSRAVVDIATLLGPFVVVTMVRWSFVSHHVNIVSNLEITRFIRRDNYTMALIIQCSASNLDGAKHEVFVSRFGVYLLCYLRCAGALWDIHTLHFIKRGQVSFHFLFTWFFDVTSCCDGHCSEFSMFLSYGRKVYSYAKWSRL